MSSSLTRCYGFTCAAAALAVAGAAVLAATPDARAQDSFAEFAGPHVYDLAIEEGKLIGSAADFLVSASEKAQFVAIAEPHNTRELPEITSALFRALHDAHGFRYAALETGPFILERAGEVPVRGGEGEIHGLFKEYYRSFHFYTDQELAMMAAIGEISTADSSPLWGVDQVHGARFVLNALAERTDDTDLRERTQALMERIAAFNANLGFNDSPFIVVDSEEIAGIASEYKKIDDERTQFLADQLLISNEIYQNYRKAEEGELTGWLSNYEREENMKNLFMHYYRAAQENGDETPRVLLKLGHRHMVRGLNLNNCYSLGNFVSEFAKSNGMEAFIVAVSAINEEGRYFSLTENEAYKPLTDLASVDAWRVIDLRPLRAPLHAGRFKVSPELREWIFQYDAALLVGGMYRGNYRIEGERRRALAE